MSFVYNWLRVSIIEAKLSKKLYINISMQSVKANYMTDLAPKRNRKL